MTTLSHSVPLRLLEILVLLFMGITALLVLVTLVNILSGHPPPLQIGEQKVSDPPPWLFGVLLLLTIVAEWLAWHLWRVIRRARLGQIFTLENVNDLRLLAFFCLLWWLTPLTFPLLQPLVNSELRVISGFNTNDLLSSPLSVALILFVFAEVLREGVRLQKSEKHMREEQELTI